MRAQLELEKVVRLIIILVIIFLIAMGIILLSGNLSSLYGSVKTFLRFGG
jgi:hypothetical protein